LSDFTLRIEKTPRKFLKTLNLSDKKRIDVALTLLTENPIPPKAKKLSGRDGYRIRVGDFRIIYEIQKNVLIVLVIDIGHRREIYRK
jgi:mRNA interferase RelE/StbE